MSLPVVSGKPEAPDATPAPDERDRGGESRWWGWIGLAAPAVAAVGVVLWTLPSALFGVRQIVGMLQDQAAGRLAIVDYTPYYQIGHLFLTAPERLYDPTAMSDPSTTAWIGTALTYPNVYPPNMVPQWALLALLPYNLSYLVWGAINLACLVASTWLLAPRFFGRWSWMLWLAVCPLFLPVQLALIYGQTSLATLLGFCVLARSLRASPTRAGWGLLPMTWKPHFALGYAVILIVGGRAKTLVVPLVSALVLAIPAVVVLGPSVFLDYARSLQAQSGDAASGAGNASPGQTLIGLSQSVFGLNATGVVVGVAASVLAYCLVAWVWRRGLADGPRSAVQLAALGMVVLLAGVRAGAYDLTIWLAVAWLLIEFGRATLWARIPVAWIVVGLWIAGNQAVLTISFNSAEWGAVAGAVALAGTCWLYAQGQRKPRQQRDATEVAEILLPRQGSQVAG